MLSAGVAVFVTILAIVFFIVTCVYSRNKYTDETGQKTVFRSQQIASFVDENYGIFEKYYIASLDDDEVDWLLQNSFTARDYSRYKAVADIMSGSQMFIEHVRGYILCDLREGWVLSDRGLMTLDELKNKEELKALYNRSVTGERRFWNYVHTTASEPVPGVDVNFRQTFDNSGLSLVIKLPENSIDTYALAVVSINMNTWKNRIQSLLEDDEEIVVTSPAGDIVYSSYEALNDAALKKSEREVVRAADGKRFIAAGTSSDVGSFTYHVFSRFKTGVYLANVATWVILLFFVLLTSVMFMMLARIAYNPVNNLVKNIVGNEKEVQGGNEFNLISRHVSGLKIDKEHLERMVMSQTSRLQEMFELHLINENIKSEDEWNDYFEGLHLPNYGYFATAVMVLDLSGETEVQSSLSEDVICLRIVDSMPAELRELLWMQPVYNSCTIFCLFGDDDEAKLLSKIMTFHEKIQRFTFEEAGLHVIMGVSNTCTEHRRIRRAYRESIKALTNSAPEGMGESSESTVPQCRFFFSNTSDRGESYANSFENEIMEALKACDKQKAYDVTNRFASHLQTVASVDISILYIMRYVNSILLTAFEANINLEEISQENLRKIYRELLSGMEPGRIRRYIKASLIDPILDGMSVRMQDDSYKIMRSIEELVEETKGDILLAECAEKLNVHQTYIWKIMKMEKGMSFTEYTEKYKTDEAKKLLLRTDMTVQEIATALNYSNAQNFIRFFSKVTGVTPGKFRKLN